MTPEQHADTVREHLPADYLGPDRNDMDGEKWGQHPEALAALDALVALAARADTLERERDEALKWGAAEAKAKQQARVLALLDDREET